MVKRVISLALMTSVLVACGASTDQQYERNQSAIEDQKDKMIQKIENRNSEVGTKQVQVLLKDGRKVNCIITYGGYGTSGISCDWSEAQ